VRICLLYCRKSRYKVEDLWTDGLYALLADLRLRGLCDSARVFFETFGNDGAPETFADPECMVHVARMSSIEDVVLEPDEVLWVRGGWKPWLPWIERQLAKGTRIIYYGANTGHERWPFWHVVLDDLIATPCLDARGRPHIPYVKPLWAGFHCMTTDGVRQQFDVCLGASYVHDKKRQWLAYEICKAYEKQYGARLRVVLPGVLMSAGEATRQMILDAAERKDTTFCGYVPRARLAYVFNQTKVFIHAASCGQGDRGVLEAAACGCHVMLLHPRRSFPGLVDQTFIAAPLRPDDIDECARLLHTMLAHWDANGGHPRAAMRFERQFGMQKSRDSVLLGIEALAHSFTSEAQFREWVTGHEH
jgi:hypothetical protein